MSTITCPGCGARFTLAAEIPAGRRLTCRKCGTSFTAGAEEEPAAAPEPDPQVDEAEPEPEASAADESPEPEPAPARGPARRSSYSRSAPAPKKSGVSPVAVVVALLLAGAGAAAGVLLRKDAPATPPVVSPPAVASTDKASPPPVAPVEPAPTKTDAASTPPAAATGPAADEMKFLEMADAAATAGDHAAAARFAVEKSLDPELAKRQWQWAVVFDKDNADARSALGQTLYEGSVVWAAEKRWLDAADLEKAQTEQAAAEAATAKAAADRASDPWLAQVDKILTVIHAGTANRLLANIDFKVSEEYRPYLILIENGTDFHFRQIGDVLTQFYANFQATWGKELGLKPVERPLVILAFKNEDGYDQFAESISGGGGRKLSETTAGVFFPTVGATVEGEYVKIAPTMIYGRGSDAYPYRGVINSGVFTHEATHQIEDYYSSLHSVERSHWFTEGFAEYSGSLIYHEKSRKYKFNDFLTHRDVEFRDTLKDKKGITWTLEEVLTLPGKAAMEQRAREKAEAAGDLSKRDALQSLFYAQAWYWIWYCKKGPRAAELWPKFEKYVAAEFQGKSGTPLFKEIFGLVVDEALEKDYLEFVQKTLLDKPKEESDDSGGEK